MPSNAAIMENEKGEILLVKRKFDPMKGFWDWPGGFVNPGESLEDSVKREIKEELGVDVTVNKISGVYEDRYLYQGIQNYALCIAVSAKITNGEITVSDDVSEFNFFSPSKIFEAELAFPSVKKGIEDYLKQK